MITLKKLRELDLAATGEAGMPRHLSAASGLACPGSAFYVVADDELHLGVFDAAGDAPGRLLRLFDGELPTEKKARKKQKPDLEAITQLPAVRGLPERRAAGARLRLEAQPLQRRTAYGSTRAASSTARRVCSTSRRCSKNSSAIAPR